jgi:hemerythrin
MAELRRIDVAPGIFWVEAPKANVSILCGCPADSVKHLMRKGLNYWTEKDGIKFETGPNVILLSDVMIQNGGFSNLSEFPVLQMLYRQGIILPGHPNNTGQKPIIMGSSSQVSAQMEYIRRGNYGLISQEEIIEAGVPPEMADEFFRMKLHFAFGEIRASETLLQTQVIEDEPAEIRDNLFVDRSALNVFRISYEGESVDVDLNLPSGQQYEAAYPLGFHRIRRESFSIIHSGEGDGWDINRPTMGSVITHQGKIYLIDAGPNIQTTLEALGIGVKEVEGIFHTHAHDDHFCGLPTFMMTDHKVKYFATKLVRASVTKKLSALLSIEDRLFEEFFEIHDLQLEQWNNIEGLDVKPILSPHPVETTVFLFRATGEDGKKTYAHFADIASFDVLEKMVTDDADAPGISRTFFDTVKECYLQTVDIKKLDIGGGLIHGQAQDFLGDKSDKIILSHTAIPLTADQREVGSEAPFGITNTLIKNYQDFAWRNAYEFLTQYLPDAPQYVVRTLLNNKVSTFDPKSIVYKRGQPIDYIYLLLSGNIEVLNTSGGVTPRNLSAGTMIGEIAGVHHLPAMATYRAIGFVDVLSIPVEMYCNYVEEFDLFRNISKYMEGREFLNLSWLFRDGLSTPVQNQIVDYLTPESVDANREIDIDDTSSIYIVRNGEAVLQLSENKEEILKKGDFCGEGAALFGHSSRSRMMAKSPMEFCKLNSNFLRQIPVIHWKLLETHLRRMNVVDM